MTPTLAGRIQTRLVLLSTLGVLWTVLVTPVLPRPGDVGLAAMYGVTMSALVLTAIAGLGWELIYHGLQQYRWEKDWPSVFGLATVVNESIVVWALLEGSTAEADLPELAFVAHFLSTWVVLWLMANGPLRVVLIRWRFRGGRVG